MLYTMPTSYGEQTEYGCTRPFLAARHLLPPISPLPRFTPFPFPRGPLKSHFSGRETSNCQIGGREGNKERAKQART